MNTFFGLKTEVKEKYQKRTGVSLNGWDELEREKYEYLTVIMFSIKL
jgi:hypothetical protein